MCYMVVPMNQCNTFYTAYKTSWMVDIVGDTADYHVISISVGIATDFSMFLMFSVQCLMLRFVPALKLIGL